MAEEDNELLTAEEASTLSLLEMVQQLEDANQLQENISDSTLKTTEVLTSIAKILQAQLDLDEEKKLKEGRQLDKVSDDDGGGFKFDKLEMPTSVADGFGLFLGAFVGAIEGFFKEITGWFTKKTNDVKKIQSQTMQRLRASYKSFKGSFIRFFTEIGNLVTKVFMKIFEPLTDLKKSFSSGGKIGKMFDGILKFFKMFKSLFVAIGRVFARIAAFIIAPILGIMKAMEEFDKQEEGGIVGKSVAALMGFITGFVDFMIVSLVDLVKSAVSWLFEKIFGEDNAVTKFLDSFSFSDLFQEGMTIIKDFFIGIPKYFKDAYNRGGGFTGMLGVLFKDYKELVTNLFGFVKELFGKGIKFITDKLGITDFLKDFKTAFVKSLEDAWTALKNVFSTAFDWVMEKLGINFDSQELVTIVSDWWDDLMKSFKDKLGAAWDGIKTFLGIDNTPTAPSTRMTTGTTTSNPVSGKNADALYEKVGFFGLSSINKANIPMASEKQLQEIIDDNDLTVDDMHFVKSHMDLLTVAKSKRPAMSESEEAAAVGKASESKAKNDAVLATSSPEELALIYAEMGIDNPAAPKEMGIDNPAAPKKIGTGTIATALNPVVTPPMMLLSSGNVPSPTLLGNEGSAVNQGQALQSGTSNLNDAKSRQQSAPPMMLSNSPNNSQTSNSNVSNNYTTSNVTAWDRYDPFANQMPSNAAK